MSDLGESPEPEEPQPPSRGRSALTVALIVVGVIVILGGTCVALLSL